MNAIKRTGPFKFKKKGDKLICEGYIIQPFEGRLIVYNSNQPLYFYDSINDAKKEVKRQLRAKFILDYINGSILAHNKIVMEMALKGFCHSDAL